MVLHDKLFEPPIANHDDSQLEAEIDAVQRGTLAVLDAAITWSLRLRDERGRVPLECRPAWSALRRHSRRLHAMQGREVDAAQLVVALGRIDSAVAQLCNAAARAGLPPVIPHSA